MITIVERKSKIKKHVEPLNQCLIAKNYSKRSPENNANSFSLAILMRMAA